MKSLLPLFPFVAALALIACQGDDGPVAEDARVPADSVVGDAGADGLAAPANAAAAEAVDRASVPVVDHGMGWSETRDRRVLAYGPTGAAAMLSFTCADDAGGRHVVVTRFHPANPGAKGTLSFTGGGHASSLPVRAVAKAGGPGESDWQGQARGDMARAVARTFARPGLVDVTLGGVPALSLPTSPLATAFFKRCLAA
jgi:hypothetical protein